MPKVVHEHVVLQNEPRLVHGVQEALQQSDSSVLYTRIRAITADKTTRNFTFYPASELRGDNQSYGYITFTHPHPVPVLREHRQSDSPFGGSAAEPMGRVIESRFVRRKEGAYVEVLAEISDPYAIEMVTSRRYLTVSIGHIPQRVECSICGLDPDREGCEHRRGEWYTLDSGEKRQCVYIMRRPQMIELSFVNVPSDNQAGVLSVESVHPIEHFVRKDGGYYSLNRWKVVESVWTADEEDRMTETAEWNQVTLGQLYHLPDDDPLFSSVDESVVELDGHLYLQDEARLTAAQRKRLPDSAFCGPNRSFPAHDRAHVLAGLRLLGRAKLSPAQKARVRACLLRKAKQLGMKTGQDSERDSAHDVLFVTEQGIYTLPRPLDEPLLRRLLTDLNDELTEYTYSSLRSLFVGRLDAESDNELFGIRNPAILANELVVPVIIPVTEQYLQQLQELTWQEPQEEPMPQTEQVSEPSSDRVSESSDPVEGSEPQSSQKEESVVESVESEIARLIGKRMSLVEFVDYYEGLLTSLREEYDGLYDRYRDLLCEYASYLAVHHGYPGVAGESVEQARRRFEERPDSFLWCLIEDLRHARPSTELVVITDAKDPRVADLSLTATDEQEDGATEPSQSIVNDVGVPKGESVSEIGNRLQVTEEEDDILVLTIP